MVGLSVVIVYGVLAVAIALLQSVAMFDRAGSRRA